MSVSSKRTSGAERAGGLAVADRTAAVRRPGAVASAPAADPGAAGEIGPLALAARTALAGAPLAALGAVVAVLAWGSLDWPLIHDAPLMHYVAWRIAEGAVPYRDVFDMNFPGVYLLHLAVLEILGPGDAAWRAFDLTWLVLGGLAIGAFASAWGATAAVGGGLLFAAYHLAAGAWNAGQRDYLLCPLLVAGALGVARWLDARHAPEVAAGPRMRPRPAGGWGALGALAAGGLALGAAATIKPHVTVLAAALGALIARGPGRGRGLTAFGVGVALPPLGVGIWLASVGALPAWRAIVLDYLVPLYSRLGRPAHWGFHRWEVWLPVAGVIAGSLATAAAGRRFGARHLVAAVGLGYGVVHYVGQGKGWEYHAYPFAAFASVLAVCEVEAVLRERRWLAAVPLAAGLTLVALLLGAKGAEAARAGWIRQAADRVDTLVAQLRPRLRAGDTVQVLDTTGGGIHALLRLGVRQPTRFLYDFHFFHDPGSPAVRQLRAEFARDLAARPPRLMVLFERGWPAGGPERVASFPELAAWLAASTPAGAGPGYTLHAQPDRP
jgi:hypothetical protein